jgi:hypothetical protein
VNTGVIGAINLPDAELLGAISPLSGSVSSLQFGSLDTKAQVAVGGSVGTLSVGSVDLGPTGYVAIGGNLQTSLTTSSLVLDGGKFAIGGDVQGALNFGSISLTHGGFFSVGRDVTGTMTVTSNLDLSTNGAVLIGRNLAGLTVNGNVNVDPSGGEIIVGATVTSVTVNGVFKGKGTPSPDLSVGLDLGNLTVLGGGAGQGGLQQASIDVGKDLLGLNIPRGIFNSLITAGVRIDGSANSSTGNIGADGVDAVVNSQILAGHEITNMTINGNVKSTFATNPSSTGYPTRIVAGEDRSGVFASAGLIDNFQITGSLMDSVLAASVQPNGGSGTFPTTAYGTPPPTPSNAPGDGGFNTYDAPAGTVAVGTVGTNHPVPNYTELSYFNEKLTGVAYDTTLDPTIDDFIFPGGSINHSFASTALSQAALTNSTTVTTTSGSSSTSATSGSSSGSQGTITITPNEQVLPIPTKSTVLGGVISTIHGDGADFAGIFAADTSGVFVGPIPTQG